MSTTTFAAAMPHTLSAPAGGQLAGLSRAARVSRSCAAGLALVTAAGLALHAGTAHDDPAAAPTPSAQAPAPRATAVRPLVSTGVVEDIRELSDADTGARRFEMTIRMRDGTSRTSTETGGARWRAGDRVSLLGGPGSL